MNRATDDLVAAVKAATSHLHKPVSERRIEDYQPFFDSLHEDVTLEYATPEGKGCIRGKRAVVDHVSGLFATLANEQTHDDVQLESPLEFLSNGERVVVLWKECKRNKRTGMTEDSKEVAVVYQFRDGLTVRLLRFNT